MLVCVFCSCIWLIIGGADHPHKVLIFDNFFQTSIVSNGFRSLADGEEVEFEIGDDPNGRARALNVTGPGGDPVKVQNPPEIDENQLVF